MADTLTRFRNAWNAFLGRDPTIRAYEPSGTYYRPDRTQMSYGNDKSIISAIYNRIAIDVSQINIRHVRVDDNGQYQETIDSELRQT